MKLRVLAAAAVLALGGVAVSESAASAATDPCSGSGFSYYGYGENALSNGTMTTYTCGTSTKVGRVRSSYAKTSGSGVTVQFGWEFVNSNATVNGGSWWSGVNQTVASGQTRYYDFNYSWGLARPSSAPCVRGKMKDVIGGTIWYTRVKC